VLGTISDVQKIHMTLKGMQKYVGVLEQAGLVTTEKVGRVSDLHAWRASTGGSGNLDREIPPSLERTLRGVGHGYRGTLKRKDKVDGRKQRI
jgi:hypothetical protein